MPLGYFFSLFFFAHYCAFPWSNRSTVLYSTGRKDFKRVLNSGTSVVSNQGCPKRAAEAAGWTPAPAKKFEYRRIGEANQGGNLATHGEGTRFLCEKGTPDAV